MNESEQCNESQRVTMISNEQLFRFFKKEKKPKEKLNHEENFGTIKSIVGTATPEPKQKY